MIAYLLVGKIEGARYPQLLFRCDTTARMIRSHLASFVKQASGRLLRRASRKAPSMALVVRTFRRCASGQASR